MRNSPKKIRFLLNFLAVFAGTLTTLAFAPFNIFPLAIIGPAILLSLWLNVSAKRAAYYGWLYGLGFFGTGVYWVFISIHTFGNTSIFIALFITCAFINILALFPACTGYLLNRYYSYSNNAKLLCAFPAIWVFLEWIRSWIFSGFPWLIIGTSQIGSPLRGYATLFSVYGVSLIALFSSGLIVRVLLNLQQGHKKAAFYNIAMLFLTGILGTYLSSIQWTHPTGRSVEVSLVQGNIAQELKWSPSQVEPTLTRYVDLTTPHWNSNIIVWPESAIPLPLHLAAPFLEDMAQQAQAHNATLITGIPIKAPENAGYYNGVIAIGNGMGVYTKHRLVPFGEYIPLRNILGKILDLLHVPMSDFIPGSEAPKPIMANGVRIATFICYEIAYPEQVLLRDGNIDLLLTVSNDAWFGRSIAQAQHVEMAQMRALEMGRPLLFTSNNGITAIINSKGKLQSIAPPYKTFVLTDHVQLMEGITPWQRFGLDPLLIILLTLLILAFGLREHDKT